MSSNVDHDVESRNVDHSASPAGAGSEATAVVAIQGRSDDLPPHQAMRLDAQELQHRIQHEIGEDLSCVEILLQRATHSDFPEVDALGRRAAAMGGKRLRPILVLLSAAASWRPGWVKPLSADLHAIAAAVELVHAASLVHDDVMDGAVQRRHQETIAQQAGGATAVLLGDFLFTRAYALAASCRTTYPARSIAAAATQLCEGEIRQQASAANWNLSLTDYQSMLLQKSAALCKVSCHLGGWRAGASKTQQSALAKFGRCLGLAFQIYDDWLDYWGDQQVGKTLGTDLAQGKPTLPLLRLLGTSTAARRQQIIHWLSPGEGRNLVAVRDALDASDAAAYTRGIALAYVQRAKQQLGCLPDSPAKDCMAAVADFCVQRAL